MKKHKKLLTILIVLGILIVANAGYFLFSKIQSRMQDKRIASAAKGKANTKTYENADLGFELKYPSTWVVNEKDDSVAINPADHGGVLYFSAAKRKDFKSLDDVKHTLAPSVQTSPIEIDTASGFEYLDTDGHQSIWLSHGSTIYIVRIYNTSTPANQMLMSIKFAD